MINLLENEVKNAFEVAGYSAELGKVAVSNRPDLCEFQCNGALSGAKIYHKAPAVIAEDAAAQLRNSAVFSEADAVKPGFLNLKVAPGFLSDYLNRMAEDEKFLAKPGGKGRRIILDYGGPNVAKPLHVGHLRSAVIGESVKRILRFCGNEVIGDIHLGDWGLQMGLVITELKKRMPDLVYFREDYRGEYPDEAPFTVSELEEIYPFASGRSKQDPEYYKEALENTHRLQSGDRGLYALWQQIVRVSCADMKKNYERLNVEFDLWNGESTVQPLIAPMAAKMKDDGYAYESEGALIVDVRKESDTREIPPCMILKSDGAALYTTTDLATIVDREAKYAPDEMIYITDKRQELHFTQVFRCAEKCGLLRENTALKHIGFGTVNGKDGHALKTRDGGVMRLEYLIDDIEKAMYEKIRTNPDIPEEEALQTAKTVSLAALKYGDLSNQPSKDYVFDLDKFISFEGDTGPYILYTVVRMNAILTKYQENGGDLSGLKTAPAGTPEEKKLMLSLSSFAEMIASVERELSPARICAYIYQLANDFNSFYHATRILGTGDKEREKSLIALLHLTREVLETCISLLGFEAPKRM